MHRRSQLHFIAWVIILTLWGSTLDAQPVLTDDFTGSRLDLTKWDAFPVGGATISTGAGLQFSLNGTQNFSTVQVFTLYQFFGDFDAQVDFTLGSGWNTPFPINDPSPQLNGGAIAVYLDEPNWMVLSRGRFPNSEGFNFYSNVDLGTTPRSQFSPSTATSGSLRIMASGGRYHFLFNQGSGWVELATAPAWSQPVRVCLWAANVNAHVSFSSLLTNFRVNSGTIDHQTYQLPSTFLRRPGFMMGGQFVNATLDRYFSNLTGYDPMSQLFTQGMSMARGCMTTVSDPDLASTPPAQWHTLGWKNSYWSSLQMMTQLYKDAMAAGMRINACFFLSDGAAGAGLQNAPAAWQNLSVVDTAALVEQFTYDTTTYLINQGIQVDFYDIGNEILFGILNFCPGDRITIPPGVDITRSISYLKTSVWPTEATLLTAAIHGVRRADPNARIVLHIESLLSPGMDTAFAFFQTMQSLGVPYDVAAISLPYMDATNLSGMMAQEYFQRFNYLVNRLASLGKPVYIAENSYPAAADPVFNPPMPDFPYANAGQAAYVNSQLRWASNNQNIIGWTWFYPEWFPGINPSAPINLELQGFYSDRQTLRPAAAELNVSLPNCPVLIYPYSRVFVAGGGNGIITVTSSGGCPWTAVSNTPWISIASSSSGSGNGTVAYEVTANTSGAPRTGTMAIGGQTFTVIQSGIILAGTKIDFDGDGRTDVGVFRGSTGIWYVIPSGGGTPYGIGWGISTDIPVPRDYDGDGKTDIAVYRTGMGIWYVYPSLGAAPYGMGWGGDASDKPVPGDYDGEGKTDYAVYRDGVWFISPSGGGAPYAIGWGIATDKPVPGDYDGDGKTDYAIYRDGAWFISPSGGEAPYAVGWGFAGDKPVPGDYDNDGKTDAAVYRAGLWFVSPSGGGTPYAVGWGIAGDKPVPGDYDGDGRTDIAVYRPTGGVWYIIPSGGASPYGVGWGGDSSDIPLTTNPD